MSGSFRAVSPAVSAAVSAEKFKKSFFCKSFFVKVF
tara:strand:- start:284 stop:391 length:108 start_codon:yes stop_codon:yes gene_type:complete